MTNNLERLNALQDAYNKINAVANTKRFKHSDPQLYLGIRVALDEVRKLISIESKKIATYHKQVTKNKTKVQGNYNIKDKGVSYEHEN